MTLFRPRNRRQTLVLLMSMALATLLRSSPRDAAAGPLDQGIGGTGAAPPTDETDRGIGGTGVIGTIRKFGSIVVNDLRIAYPADAAVIVDGRPASVSDLKIGQVVRVEAADRAGGLSTRTINVASEVVGPVERVSAKQMTVLGQTVSTAALGRRSFEVGDTVAVSGLRRNDGTIVASLVEPREGAPSRVAGPVTLAPDGGLKIGGLRLVGLDADLIGERAIVEGQPTGNRLAVSRAVAETSLLPNVRTLSVESYVERRGDRLALGSGFAVAGGRQIDLPQGQSVRAVLTTTVGEGGQLSVDNARANGRTYGGPSGGAGGASGSSGSRGGAGSGPAPSNRSGGGPMDFGHGAGTPGAGSGGPGGAGFSSPSTPSAGAKTPPGSGGGGGGGRGGGRR